MAGGVGGHPVLLDVGEEEGRPVELVGGQGLHDLLVAAVQRDPQHRDLRLAALPVLRVAPELVDGGLEATHLGERPRAHRVGVVVSRRLGHALPLVLGNDRLMPYVVEARRVGPLEGELNGRRVDGGDVAEEAP